MRIHHLNVGTLCPRGARWVNGTGGPFQRARLVCHALLLETEDGLVLVETGLGTRDIADPARLGKSWVRLVTPKLDPSETAIARVRALGFAPSDVRHIVLTHLDLDHAGGLEDFPDATVHVHQREHDALMGRVSVRAGRYIPAHFRHGPRWKLWNHDGERWFGFDAVRSLLDGEPDILLIPLFGHTAGHCGVAVRGPDKWLLHAGDAFFHQTQITGGRTPLGLRYFQRRADTDRALRRADQAQLSALHSAHGHEIEIFNAHDPLGLLGRE